MRVQPVATLFTLLKRGVSFAVHILRRICLSPVCDSRGPQWSPGLNFVSFSPGKNDRCAHAKSGAQISLHQRLNSQVVIRFHVCHQSMVITDNVCFFRDLRAFPGVRKIT